MRKILKAKITYNSFERGKGDGESLRDLYGCIYYIIYYISLLQEYLYNILYYVI